MQEIHFKRIIPGDEEYAKVFELREELLRQPLGLSLHDEDLSAELNDYTLVAMDEDNILACLILTPRGGDTVQLRQMAVWEDLQGSGIGKRLVDYAEQYAWDEGYDSIILHARIVAQGFYEKLNYKVVSDVFTEVGIPHVVMEKHKA